MPPATPVQVPPPSKDEQIRLLAEAFAGIRDVLAVMTQHAQHFIPGEAHEEVIAAWNEGRPIFDEVIRAILERKPVRTETGTSVTIDGKVLEDNQLLGSVGTAKTSLWRRLKERFFHLWNTLPTPDLEKTPAVAAGMQYLEFSANIAGSIPGAGPIKELLHLYKQHLSLRLQQRSSGG